MKDIKTWENATHLLECAHAIGLNRYEYEMRCHVLKTMPDGRVKVLVFGDMYWKRGTDKSRIRYVFKHRVRLRT